MQQTKDDIKTSMLKTASKFWGFSFTEAENNFDPLVSMLMGACAVELEKISGEIHSSRARVMERVVQQLTPDALTGPLPAHALACGTPIEANAWVREDMQFYTRLKKNLGGEGKEPSTKDVFFSPTGNFPLKKTNLCLLMAGGDLYAIHNDQKELVGKSTTIEDQHSVWLGLQGDMDDLKGGLFYFDLRSEVDRDLFYHHLPNCRWTVNGVVLKTLSGHGACAGNISSLSTTLNLAAKERVLPQIKDNINTYYDRYFVRVMENLPQQDSCHQPALDGFEGKDLTANLEGGITWIRISFPSTISPKSLKDLICVMNCFPVMNRQLHHVHFKVQEHINVLPLQSPNLFLDLEKVEWSNEEAERKPQHPVPFCTLFREGAVGRFDERDAASILQHLLHLLKDESAAFSLLDNDFVKGEIKGLQQIINKLENRLNGKGIHGATQPYLITYPGSRAIEAPLAVTYSSTEGVDGNRIKSGTRLLAFNGNSFVSDNLRLATPTSSGRNALMGKEKMLAYKYALLTKGSLSTSEDLKAYCHAYLGEKLSNCEIEKGVRIHTSSAIGFEKVLKIILTLEVEIYREMERMDELRLLEQQLEQHLTTHSLTWIPIEVHIKCLSS